MPVEYEEQEGGEVAAESTPAAAGGDAAPAEAPAAPEVPEWDGSFDTVEKLPWWGNIPEKHRETLLQRNADHTLLKTLLEQDDGAAKVAEEMATLRTSLGAEVTKWKSEAETHKKSASDWQKKHDDLRSEVENERLDRQVNEMKAKYADIFDSVERDDEGNITGGALKEFVRLVEIAKVDPDKAAKAVRAMFDMPTPGAAPAAPEKPKVRETALPPSVELANKNGLNPDAATEKPAPVSPEEAHRRFKAKLDAEEPVE